MKRSFALALIASLLAAPIVLAQPPATPPSPTPAKAPDTKAAPAKKHDDAQPKKDGKGGAKDTTPASADDAMKAVKEAAKPGPNHKLLEQFEGEWQAEVKDLTPGAETVDKGTMTSKLVYGGRFLSMDFAGKYHNLFFRGGGMMGYNNADKRFESTWADSVSTGILFKTGSASADGKVFTMTGEITDPVSGKKTSQKEVTTITGKGTYKQESYWGDQKLMEITYTKGKAADKPEEKKEEKAKGK